MAKKDWTSVFEHYPDVQTIWVCDNQPFLSADQARAHERTTGKPVEEVNRPKQKAKRRKRSNS